MSEAMGIAVPVPATVAAGTRTRAWTRVDAPRVLQLSLAAIWLLDGILQLQGFFFTRAFGTQMIATMAQGNPYVIARPITWAGTTIAHHAQLADSAFAVIQIAIGLGIAWRPTRKVALGTSIAWSVGVWWIGEGLGGVLNGGADPVTGAPGAVMLYALLAVLLWPRQRGAVDDSFAAATGLGARWARGLWLLLWGSLAYFAVAGSNSASQGLHDLIAPMASGEPGWMAWLDRHVASLCAHHGLPLSVVLAVLLGCVAIGVYLPRRVGNALVVAAIVVAAAFWVVGQNFGALFTNSATDVNSGPLLALLAVSFWRPASLPDPAPAAPDGPETTGARSWP